MAAPPSRAARPQGRPESRPESRPVPRAAARVRRGSIWTDATARTRFLRRALPIAIGVLVLLLAGWIAVRALLTSLGERRAAVGEVRMLHPRFYGRDGRGRPFTINAVAAVRDARDPNQVNLERPVFLLQNGAAKPSVVQSLTGLYREDTRNLILSGQVTMDDSQDNHFASERALVDTVNSVVTGETAVVGTGPLGRITASSYAIYDGGARTVFTGNVKAHLKNSNGKSGT